MAVYKYLPIDLGGPAIRLLRLLRGNLTDNIQCDLFEGWINQLEGGIPYDALSYTWESTEKPAKITVNGSTMHVTLNLYIALQHLRFEDKDRILWIDAICIDQENHQERGHQVQQMSCIYKEAEQVVIWLGQSTEEADLTMDFIKQLHEDNVAIGGDWRSLAKFWMHTRYPDLEDRMRWRKGMEFILGRPWFSRIWILQEIANARVATILCGKKSVSARTFAQVPPLIGLQPHPHCQAILDIMPGLSRKVSWWSDKRNLHTLLAKFRGSQATDERDIIYALLGISSDACRSDILLPDYTKSLQQVIRDTISFLLSPTNQDESLYKFLDWTLSRFLQSLDSLSSAVLGSACANGEEAIVRLLLATDGLKANSKDKYDWTPLQRATWNGHDAVVRLLLAEGAELEVRDEYGRTPLSWAAQHGHEAVVKLLLAQGAELELRDMYDRTPLSWAAGNGHEAVVKLLLAQGAELETNGRTPLSWAAESGREAVVKLLLAQGAKLETNDRGGRTPLSWAAENGHEAVVMLLLAQEDIRRAGRNGHEVVKQLLA
ncbi:ankyrin repeat-containing domain protein [Cenococcum geophilum]